MHIRSFEPGDERAAYYVCLKTGNHGDDGEPYYKSDPGALGRIYVGPYLRYAPDFALMLQDDQGICGYALGTLDSKAFYDRYEQEWRKELIARFPQPSGDACSWDRVQQVHFVYHNPEYYYPRDYDQYPAHLHIDLLPRAQGQGFGKAMMHELLDRLKTAGAPGVHLGMSVDNDRAYRFYQKLGFVELERNAETIYLGLAIEPSAHSG